MPPAIMDAMSALFNTTQFMALLVGFLEWTQAPASSKWGIPKNGFSPETTKYPEPFVN
jgi:hypothetical protein